MRNFFINIFVFLILLVGQVQINSVYANTTDSNVSVTDINVDVIKAEAGLSDINTGPVTIDDATNYVNEKGTIFVGFIQNIAKPITVVIMVLSALMGIIVSLVGGKDAAGKFFASFMISSVCYLGVMFAPLLLQLLVGFVTP